MPYSFMPINGGDLPSITNQMNRNFAKLDAEAVTKKFGKDENQVVIGKAGDYTGMVVGDVAGDAMIVGRYQSDRIGTLYINDGIPSELSGQHPVDGHMGHWIATEGSNVITELGGTW